MHSLRPNVHAVHIDGRRRRRRNGYIAAHTRLAERVIARLGYEVVVHDRDRYVLAAGEPYHPGPRRRTVILAVDHLVDAGWVDAERIVTGVYGLRLTDAGRVHVHNTRDDRDLGMRGGARQMPSGGWAHDVWPGEVDEGAARRRIEMREDLVLLLGPAGCAPIHELDLEWPDLGRAVELPDGDRVPWAEAVAWARETLA